MASHTSKGGKDTRAAFMGLLGGAIFIFVILYSIVLLTNRKYAGLETAKASSVAPVSAPSNAFIATSSVAPFVVSAGTPSLLRG